MELPVPTSANSALWDGTTLNLARQGIILARTAQPVSTMMKQVGKRSMFVLRAILENIRRLKVLQTKMALALPVTQVHFPPHWVHRVPIIANSVQKDTSCQIRQVSTVCLAMVVRINLAKVKLGVRTAKPLYILTLMPTVTTHARLAHSVSMHPKTGSPLA